MHNEFNTKFKYDIMFLADFLSWISLVTDYRHDNDTIFGADPLSWIGLFIEVMLYLQHCAVVSKCQFNEP